MIQREAIEKLRALGGEELVLQMIETFLAEVPRLTAEFETAVRDADWKAIAFAAHQLKSSASYFGAVELQELATLTEKAARSPSPVGIEELVRRLVAEHREVSQQLARERGRKEQG